MHKPRAIHTIRYLREEPIKNLAAVRAAYSWLGVDDPQIQYAQYRGNDTWCYANCTAAEATHFSVYPNNKIGWWNRYIHNESVLRIIAEIREEYYNYEW